MNSSASRSAQAEVQVPAAWVPNLHLALLLTGACLTGLAYDSVEGMAIGPLVLALGALPIALWGLALGMAKPLLAGYARVFSVAWFMAGTAAAYAQWLNDPYQLGSDAFGFYQLASGAASGLGLDELREISDGAGAVLLWRAVYDLAAEIGIGRLRFVGIAFNTVVVALTAAVALRTCRLMFGPHPRRESILVLAFSGCGMVWIFAAIHLRDAMIFLAASLVTLAWVHFLRRSSLFAAIRLVLWMTALSAAFAVLRTEFIFVPLMASVVGLVAIATAPAGLASATRLALRILLLLATGAAAWIFVGTGVDTLDARSESYREMVRGEASASSLGAQLVVNQPTAVRALAGSLYLLTFPIPVWSGLFGDSALHLFKSLNALYLYALLPLLAMAAVDLARSPDQRSPDRLFVLGMTVLFILTIALTSLESRHLGSFLVPIFLLALVPDPDGGTHGRRYRRALVLMLLSMATIHAAWALAKFSAG